jgi:ferredoxin
MKIVVDLSSCMGYANCVEEAPDVFALGKGGVVVLLDESPPPAQHPAVLKAVEDCPTGALATIDGEPAE